MSKRRVVITGLGVLSAVGLNVEENWSNILAGKSGIDYLTKFDTDAFSVKFGGELKGFDVSQYIVPKEAKKMDPFIHYGIAAGAQAIKDSGLEITDENATRIGVSIGSGIGGIGSIETQHKAMLKSGPRRVSPFFVPSSIINMISGNLSIMFGLKGPNMAIGTACATGTHSIGDSARMIQYGDVDVMVAGGAEGLCPTQVAVFDTLYATSTRNAEADQTPRPFDEHRDGLVIGEGAGTLILEEREHALARGAHIHAELIGFGTNSDGKHVTQPESDTMFKAMSLAIEDAGCDSSQIGYVSAHGTATDRGDVAESNATHRMFGSAMPISALKSYTGHTLGACGALEAMVAIRMMEEGWFHGTANLEHIDPECGELNYLRAAGAELSVETVMSNNFAFGGINTSLIFSRV